MTQRKTGRQSSAARQSRKSRHLAKEVRSIQQRAAEQDGRVVRIGPLVFFFTDTGDAWMLEPASTLPPDSPLAEICCRWPSTRPKPASSSPDKVATKSTATYSSTRRTTPDASTRYEAIR